MITFCLFYFGFGVLYAAAGFLGRYHKKDKRKVRAAADVIWFVIVLVLGPLCAIINEYLIANEWDDEP